MIFSNWNGSVIYTYDDREVKEHCSLLCPFPPFLCMCFRVASWHRLARDWLVLGGLSLLIHTPKTVGECNADRR